jgi:hypothetical protein
MMEECGKKERRGRRRSWPRREANCWNELTFKEWRRGYYGESL